MADWADLAQAVPAVLRRWVGLKMALAGVACLQARRVEIQPRASEHNTR